MNPQRTPKPGTPGTYKWKLSTAVASVPSGTFYAPSPLGDRNPFQFGQPPPLVSTPSRPSTSGTTAVQTPTSASSSKKRKCVKENITSDGTSSKRAKRRTDAEKMEEILNAIQGVGWSFSQFIFRSFEWKDAHRTQQHASMTQTFLSGRGEFHVGHILKQWLTSPDGRNGSEEHSFSLDLDYEDVRPVRACLKAFAAHLVKDELIREAENAVSPKSGLHASFSPASGKTQTQWVDVGATTVPEVGRVIRVHQPLTWQLLTSVAARRPRQRNGVVAVRKTRPVDVVATHVIAQLNFSRNRKANLLPTALGLYYFAHSAPVDLVAYGSRIGITTAYSTSYEMMRQLAKQKANFLRILGADPRKSGRLIVDNIQTYRKQWDMRVGRDSTMVVGIGATYIESPTGTNPAAFDLKDKQARIEQDKRKDLTADDLLEFIDQEHLEVVGTLQWIQTLVNHIPKLARYKPTVTMLYGTRAVKQRIPDEPAKVHPLGTSGKNETISSELKAAILDFLEQLGNTSKSFIERLIPIGGDGLTFQKILKLKNYLQFHDNAFESLSMLEPLLEWWHTMWTDLSRIYETHWGEELSKDPSTLGHSASKINRDIPGKLNKVDYYPACQLAYSVLDARMLDCWRLIFEQEDLVKYFEELPETEIPQFEDLEKLAKKLYRAYSTTQAMHSAMGDVSDAIPGWETTVPVGSTWSGVDDDASSEGVGIKSSGGRSKKKSSGKRKKNTKIEVGDDFQGDWVLARGIAFIRDTMLSREAAYAVADGDVGRVYEVLKVMLFTFAGTSHTKYTNYLLEAVTTFELECSAKLREALLSLMVFNLSGIPGHGQCGDLIQEHFNRLLEFIVERKGKDFEHTFIREIISRNLHNLSRLKKDLREGVGLAKKSTKHSEPHTRPEFKILSKVYRERELHSRRTGRVIDRRKWDNFTDGWSALYKGKARQWATETSQRRKLHRGTASFLGNSHGDEDDSEDDDGHGTLTMGTMARVDGELLVATFGVESAAQEMMDEADRDDDQDE